MAEYFIYETRTGVNFVVRGTTDPNYAVGADNNLADSLRLAKTGPDPNMPDGKDVGIQKVFVSGTNTVQNATAGQIIAWNLFLARAAKNLAIDRKTTFLFNKGLNYDGEVFPLQIDDFANYMSDYVIGQGVTFPKTIITKTRTAYTIANANAMKAFFEAAAARKDVIVDGARDLKLAIQAASTAAAVNAITDDRT